MWILCTMLTDFCKNSTYVHGNIAIFRQRSENSCMILASIKKDFRNNLKPLLIK